MRSAAAIERDIEAQTLQCMSEHKSGCFFGLLCSLEDQRAECEHGVRSLYAAELQAAQAYENSLKGRATEAAVNAGVSQSRKFMYAFGGVILILLVVFLIVRYR